MPADTNETPESRRTQPMLSSVHFKNYRGFEDYKVEGLRRINLFVGKNNAGKSSILEGIRLLLAGGDPDVLCEIHNARSESQSSKAEMPHASNGGSPGIKSTGRYYSYAAVAHVFRGHRVEIGSTATIQGHFSDQQNHSVSLSVERMDEKCDLAFFNNGEEFLNANWRLQLVIDADGWLKDTVKSRLPLSESGMVSSNHCHSFSLQKWKLRGESYTGENKRQFLGLNSLDNFVLSALWGRVLRNSDEKLAIESLRILEPRIVDVDFVPTSDLHPPSSDDGFLIALEGQAGRIPLGSLGEGVRRMFSLVLATAYCFGDTLLIDEADTGFHYSVMPEFWHLIAEAAKHYGVQIFATTHSLDCLRGLASMCEDHPELGEEIAVHKLDRRLTKAVTLFKDEIQAAMMSDIEVR